MRFELWRISSEPDDLRAAADDPLELRPAPQRIASLLEQHAFIVDASDAAARARHVIDHELDHVAANSSLGHVGDCGSPQVVQRPVGNGLAAVCCKHGGSRRAFAWLKPLGGVVPVVEKTIC